jgi:hypothetical protein
MTHFAVQCADKAVRRETERWLADARAAPPQPIAISLVLTDTPWTGGDARPSLGQAGLRIHYGEPDGSVRVVWREGIGHAVVAPGAEARVSIELVASAVEPGEPWLRGLLLPALIVALRRVGWHHVHAAVAREPTGRGWLIAGDAYAGKSTTAALLARHGWSVGADDTAFLVDGPDGVEAVAWRAPIALRSDAYALLARSGGRPLPQRGKIGFLPEELGGTWLPRVRVHVVALAARHNGPTRLEPLRPAAAVAELLSWSRLGLVESDGAQVHLDLLARAARQARCFRLRLGPDLFDSTDPLRELLP